MELPMYTFRFCAVALFPVFSLSVFLGMLVSSGCAMGGDSTNSDVTTLCTTSLACGAGRYCDLGTCKSGEAPTSPIINAPMCACTGRQSCDLSSHTEQPTCIEPSLCTHDGDCLFPRICFAGDCTASVECRTDQDCGAAEGCDKALHLCVPTVCSATAMCPVGRYCDTFSHCVGCTDNAHCTDGRICQNGSCGAPSPCSDDAQCDLPAVCNSNGLCLAPACVNDNAEPNETASTATIVSPGIFTLMLCTGDQDFYCVDGDVGDGALLRVSRAAAATGEFFGRLYQRDGTSLENTSERISEDGVLMLNYGILPSAGYCVALRTDDESVQIALSLDLQIISGGSCFDDTYEPNDIPAAATIIDDNPLQQSLIVDSCPDSIDWYTVAISGEAGTGGGTELVITIDTVVGTAPIAALYKLENGTSTAAGNTILLSRDSGSYSPKTLRVVNNSALLQNYLLQVKAAGGQHGGTKITFNTSTLPPPAE